MSKYKIGQIVYKPEMRHGETHITCPDCFGKRFLTVILGDSTAVTVDCGTCSVGYAPPSGIVRLPTYAAELTTVCIDSVITKLVNEQEICLYSGDGMHETPESDLFLIEEIQAATERADALAKEHTEEEAKRILRKEKDMRTWAWNICYRRRQIKEAEPKKLV